MVAPSSSQVVADIALDLEDGPVGHERLARALRRAVDGGRLPRGTHLPPSRELAGALGCSRWVVTEAYGLLVADGTLAARTGSGTWVEGSPVVEPAAPIARVPAPVLDLTPGVPELASFPRARWRRALAAALATASHDDLAAGGALGLPRLRAELGPYLARSRGAVVTPQVAVGATRGTSDTLDRLFRILRRYGLAHVALEEPSADHVRVLAEAEGLTVVPVGVDQGGLRVEDLVRTPARAVVVAPTLHYPLSYGMAPERREALVRWARDVDGVVIEHDRDGPLTDARHSPVLQSVGPDRVILVGSLDTSVSPGLGLGWIALPELWLRTVAPMLPGMAGPPTVEQLALAEIIADGALDRHVRRMRARYRARGRQLGDELARALPDWSVRVPEGGLHLLATMPPGTDGRAALALTDAARRRGLLLTTTVRLRVEPGPGPATFALGFANLRDAQIGPAVSAFVAAARAGAAPPTA